MDPVKNNLIKQPKPSYDSPQETKKAPKRQINRPQVGVVNPAVHSTTPINDMLLIKKQELPKPKIEPPKKSNKNLNFHNFLSVITGVLAIFSLISLKKH